MLSQLTADTTVERILDAAQQLIVAGGPAAATVSAIAHTAGLSRMTVYRKFDDRGEILSALFNRELGGIVRAASGVSAPDERERIGEVVTRAVSAITGHPLMTSVLQNAPEELVPWMTERLGVTQRHAREMLRTLIEAGQGEGSVRHGDADEMALTLVLVAQAHVFGHRLGASTPELRRLVDGYLA
jgi:AcrR family transcriptional regulator